MKRRSIMTVLALAAVCCLLFAGCAGNAKYPDASVPMQDGGWNYNNKEAFYDGAAPDNAAAPMNPADPGSSVPQLPLNRKVIRNAELSAETLEFDAMLSALNAKVNELGGYVQSNSVNGRSYGSKTALRTAHMVARIPAEKLDEFLTAVDGLGNVISRNEKVDDVTDSYVDIEARLASLRTEYQTLLDLLSKAEELEDVITLQDRLSDVRYEIESFEARIRSYDSLIEYSTVDMTVNEVERETAAVEESFGEEVSRRFSESLEDVGDGFKSFAAWFIGDLPVILVLLVLLVGIPLMIVLICVKSAKKRRAKKAAQAEADNKK